MHGARFARKDATGVTMLDSLPRKCTPSDIALMEGGGKQPQQQQQQQQQKQQQQQHCQEREASKQTSTHTWLFETNSRTDGPCSCSIPP